MSNSSSGFTGLSSEGCFVCRVKDSASRETYGRIPVRVGKGVTKTPPGGPDPSTTPATPTRRSPTTVDFPKGPERRRRPTWTDSTTGQGGTQGIFLTVS